MFSLQTTTKNAFLWIKNSPQQAKMVSFHIFILIQYQQQQQELQKKISGNVKKYFQLNFKREMFFSSLLFCCFDKWVLQAFFILQWDSFQCLENWKEYKERKASRKNISKSADGKSYEIWCNLKLFIFFWNFIFFINKHFHSKMLYFNAFEIEIKLSTLVLWIHL